MNDIHTFQVKQKLGTRGCIAAIYLMFSQVPGSRGVDLTFESPVDEFQSAIRFGVDYFYEQYQRKGYKNRLKVTVVQFSEFPVDTNFIVSAYVTVQALAKGLSISIDGLRIDESTGSFRFPV